jgi:uncharacterized membrane protein YjfL (UPF0719 family)
MTIVAAIGFAVAIGIAYRLLDFTTPGVKELVELNKGNTAVGLLMAGFTLAVAITVFVVLNK